jgi:hypothetical protein
MSAPATDRPDPKKKLADLRARLREAERLADRTGAGGEAYRRHKHAMTERSRAESAEGREVGPIPAVADPARREACRSSLRRFCETYLAETFSLPWSPDHLTVIARIEEVVVRGGLFALAMPRGSGKTSLAEAAALWAILYGHRCFVLLIGATDDAAREMMDSIKLAIETGDEIGEDFPEVTVPVRALDGINNRAAGQTVDRKRTRIRWTDSEVVLPTVAGSAASGSRVRVVGITGRVRGMKAKTADGRTIRPDLCIPDDPQTDDSAESPPQTDKRERVLRGAIKGLAGPGKTIALILPCTVIAQNDLADRCLDRDRHPQFRGERLKLVYQFPKDQDRWDEYARIRRESMRAGGDGSEATEFYRAHRAAMDEGAVVAWAERFDPETEESAVQAAMNLKIDNPWQFEAEYQGQPLAPNTGAVTRKLDEKALTHKERLNRVPRRMVPHEAVKLTAFIDGRGEILWYVVAGLAEGFGGGVVDHGTWPPQPRTMFQDTDPPVPLSAHYPGLSEEQRIYRGLADLTDYVLGRNYQRHDAGELLTIEKCLIDEGYSDAAVYQFCRESPFKNILFPSKGSGATAKRQAVRRWKKRPGETFSPPTQPAWIFGPVSTGKGRHITFDTDEWKSFAAERLLTPPGGTGCLRLFGDSGSAHELFARHLTCEMAAEVTIDGRTFDKWGKKPGRNDNHWWDCTVGAVVAASLAGLPFSTSGTPEAKPPPRQPLRYADRPPPGGPGSYAEIMRQREQEGRGR